MKDTDTFRTQMKTTIEQLPKTEAQLPHVQRRARALHKRRAWARAGIVPLILLLALPVGGLALWSRNGAGSPSDGSPSPSTTSVGGLSMTAPAGWSTQAFLVGEQRLPLLRAATFDLIGSDLSIDRQKAQMTTEDRLVQVVDESPVCPCGGFTPSSLPVSLSLEDISDSGGHVIAAKKLSIDNRYLWVSAEFGTASPSQTDWDSANAVIGTLAIQAPHSTAVPTNECGTQCWATSDQAVWVRTVVKLAGYTVTDSTGSAIVAGRSDTSFYIWTTKGSSLDGLLAQDFTTEYRFGSGQVVTDGIRHVFEAQGLRVWLSAGPYQDSNLPDEGGFRSVVEAAQATQAP
jgi:hypothetical protein